MDSSDYSGKVRKEPNRIYSWELIWTFVSILDLSELKEKWLKKKKKKNISEFPIPSAVVSAKS